MRKLMLVLIMSMVLCSGCKALGIGGTPLPITQDAIQAQKDWTQAQILAVQTEATAIKADLVATKAEITNAPEAPALRAEAVQARVYANTAQSILTTAAAGAYQARTDAMAEVKSVGTQVIGAGGQIVGGVAKGNAVEVVGGIIALIIAGFGAFGVRQRNKAKEQDAVQMADQTATLSGSIAQLRDTIAQAESEKKVVRDAELAAKIAAPKP